MEGFSQFTKIDIAPMPLNKDISAQVSFEQKTVPTPNEFCELSQKKEKNPQGFRQKWQCFLLQLRPLSGEEPTAE